ncbi:MAG: TonB-dependent receptor [Saprospiraceae bacterium]
MRTKITLASIVFLFLIGQTFGQNKLTGKITDADSGEALIGATVVFQNSSSGTVTDIDGGFELINDGNYSTLEVSYTGYENLIVEINGRDYIEIELGSGITELNEVIVVGYGVQKKSVVTGAISKVTAAELEDQPISRIEQALQGRTAGVRVTLNSGQPGAGATVRIRGTATIGNSDPLYIVDGVQIEGGIDYLNQNDIESIEVLKDAASAAIYGARAGNGVVIVTTKKGKKGSMVVNYNGFYGVQNPWRKLNLLNAREYAILTNEASAAAGQGIVFEDPNSLGEGTDWQDAIFNYDAPIQNHEISMSSGSERSTYYLSFGYFDQEGIVGNKDDSRWQRFTTRFNASHKITDRVEFGSNIAYSHVVGRGVAENTEFGSPLGRAINLDPITPLFETDETVLSEPRYANNFDQLVRDSEGRIYGISDIVTSEILNPVAALEVAQGKGWSDKIVSNFYGQWEIIDGLKFRSSIGSDLAFYGGEGFTPVYYLNAANRVDVNSYNRSQNRGLFWNWENVLTYERVFGDHHLSLLAGTGAQKNQGRGIGGSIQNLPVDNIGDASLSFPNDPATQSYYGFEYEETLSSLFGRLAYDFRSKYLLTMNIRRDGSSKFGPNKLYGVFPSISAGWVLTEEYFLQKNPVINFLKIRGSYGVNGNNRIGNFLFVSTVGGGRSYTFGTSDNLVNGVSPNAIANPDLKWEETSEINIGVDARVFRHFSLTAEYFNKATDGMLLGTIVPAFVGNAGPVGNIASLENEGLELELGFDNKVGPINLNLSGNLAYVKNTITNLGQDKEFLNGQTYGPQGVELTRTVLGQAIGSFYGYQSDGLFQNQAEIDAHTNTDGELLQPNAKPGDIRFLDSNGDGVFDEDDRTIIGDPTPSWTYGVNMSIDYKGFDISMFGQGVWGNDVYNAVRRFDLPKANYTSDALGRWTGEGTSTTFPRLNFADGDPNLGNGNFTRSSDFWLESGAYFRIKTLQLGYTLPAAISQKAGIQKARIYISGNNLVTITAYKGLDPEVGASFGVDRGIYPQPRFYLVGANVTFGK